MVNNISENGFVLQKAGGINSRDIDLVLLGYCGLSSRRIEIELLGWYTDYSMKN